LKNINIPRGHIADYANASPAATTTRGGLHGIGILKLAQFIYVDGKTMRFLVNPMRGREDSKHQRASWGLNIKRTLTLPVSPFESDLFPYKYLSHKDQS